MDEQNAVQAEAPRRREPGSGGLLAARDECAKEARNSQISFIADIPENQVILSPRLEQLVCEVGGCQTEQLRALVRRVMFEVISKCKY